MFIWQAPAGPAKLLLLSVLRISLNPLLYGFLVFQLTLRQISVKEEEQLTSHQKTDSSAHLDKRSKQQHMSLNLSFNVHSPEAL